VRVVPVAWLAVYLVALCHGAKYAIPDFLVQCHVSCVHVLPFNLTVINFVNCT